MHLHNARTAFTARGLARRAMLVGALAVAVLVPSAAAADTPATWLRIGDPANPPVFNNPLAVYDSLGDRLLAYQPVAGLEGAPVAAGDLWEFRLARPDSGWRKLAVLGSPPLGHVQASMVLDEATHRLILFGGWMPYGGSMSNDLYVLSLDGPPAWSVIATTSDSLRVRLDAFLAVDAPRRRLVLHGGSAYFGDHFGSVDDTWTLPLDGPPVWTLTPPAAPLPPGRQYEQVAWDAAHSRMLVHGGMNSVMTGALSDTWAMTVDATAHWDQLATTGLQFPRVYSGALVDAARDRLVVAPGYGNGVWPAADDRRAYELPLAPGGEWAVAAAADTFEADAGEMSVAFDSRRNRMLTLSPVFLHAFSLGDDTGWRRLWPPDPVRAPEAMTGAVLVSDPAHTRLWQVGGRETCGFAGLWSLEPSDAADWTRVPLARALPSGGHSVALDGEAQRLVVFSSLTAPELVTTISTAGTPAAQGFAPSGTAPGFRVDASLVVDPVRRTVVLFGGQYFAAHFTGFSYGDVWTAPLDDLSAWTPLATPGPAPGPRGEHFAFWDDVHGRMVMFGGWPQSGGPIRHYYTDAWALSFEGAPAWTALDGAAWNPPVRGRLTYDPTHHRLYSVTSGTTSSPAPALVFTRGVEDGDAWTPLATDGPAPLSDAPVAFAPWCDRLVVATSMSDGPQADEVYALQLDHAVAALASLESVEASPGRVVIRWRVSGGASPVLTLARRADTGAWGTLTTLRPDGEGRVAYEDLDVAPGQHLTYRLANGADVLAEQAVLVPARTPLAFAGARPSPARGAARLAFALPADSPVTLELFDVRGARVLARELGVLGAGEHVWTWTETAGLRPGLYLARLTTAAGRRDARLVLLP